MANLLIDLGVMILASCSQSLLFFLKVCFAILKRRREWGDVLLHQAITLVEWGNLDRLRSWTLLKCLQFRLLITDIRVQWILSGLVIVIFLFEESNAWIFVFDRLDMLFNVFLQLLLNLIELHNLTRGLCYLLHFIVDIVLEF